MFGTLLFGQGLFGSQVIISVYDYLFERINVSSRIDQEYTIYSRVSTSDVALSSPISKETSISSTALTPAESEYGPI